MTHRICCLAATLAFLVPSLAAGQANLVQSLGGGAKAQNDEKDEPKTTKLTVRPMGEHREALAHRLLPGPLDRKPGNAAVLYLKAAMLRADVDRGEKAAKVVGRTSEWRAMPLAELPLKEAKEALGRYSQVLDHLDLAARRSHCDWQVPVGELDMFTLPLNEVPVMRSLAGLVALRTRVQVAEGRLDEAIGSLQTGYAMARHAAEGPTLVHGLVGIAISGLMCEEVQTLIEQRGAPNLYWALTALPRPLIDLCPAAEMEMNVLYTSVPGLRELDVPGRGPDHWRNLLEDLLVRFTPWWHTDESHAWRVRVGLTAMALRGYPVAKRGLIEHGRSADEVEAMPVPHVVAIYTMTTYNESRDQLFKWFYVPYWQAREHLDEARRQFAEDLEVVPVASMLLPAMGSARLAQARGERDIALLRVIEALRIHAAGHDGRPPAKLSDVTEVPLPIDPIHGIPFQYQRQGDTAVLQSSAPPGQSQRAFGIRFEIRFDRGGD